jgi:hypothetical protein
MELDHLLSRVTSIIYPCRNVLRDSLTKAVAPLDHTPAASRQGVSTVVRHCVGHAHGAVCSALLMKISPRARVEMS